MGGLGESWNESKVCFFLLFVFFFFFKFKEALEPKREACLKLMADMNYC